MIVKSIMVVVLAAWIGLCGAEQRPLRGEVYRRLPNEVLVKLRPGATRADLLATVRAHRAKVVAEAPAGRVFAVRAPDQAALDDFCADARRRPQVEFIAPHHLIPLADTFPDDLAPEQWSLHNTGQLLGRPDVDIDAPGAWDFTTGTQRIVVAVIDSGIRLDHPDLTGNLWRNPGEIPDNGLDDDGNGYTDDVVGWNFRNGTNDPGDELGHGTMVAGIIGAVGNNGVGMTGVAWRVSLMALNSFGAESSTEEIYLIQAIDYAVAMGAQIINASWGTVVEPRALNDAVRRACDAGLLVTAAAGNEGLNADDSPFFPGALAHGRLLNAGAITQSDALATFSNWGKQSVHFLAPGVIVWSTDNAGGYRAGSGTSFAAPHAAGVAALLWSYYDVALPGGADADFVRGKILGGGEPVTAFEEDAAGPGRLNAQRPFLAHSTGIGAVGDLRVRRTGYNGAELIFTVPGDQGGRGPVLYDVRIGREPITAENFFAQSLVRDVLLPAAPGTTQTLALTQLDAASTWCVALRALDQAGNYTAVSNAAFFTTTSPQVLFSEDAESTPAGALWTAGGDWHRSAHQPHSGDWAWSTTRGEHYPINQDMSLISPPLDLSAAALPVLEFYHRYLFQKEFGPYVDYGEVQVSLDGGTAWTTAAVYKNYMDEWRREQLALPSAGGRTGVLVRFHFFSDALSDPLGLNVGWLIDDIRVTDGADWIAAPRRLLLGPHDKLGRLHPPPLYEETPAGQWFDHSGRTTMAGGAFGMCRYTSIEDGLNGRATLTPCFPASGRYDVWVSWGVFANARNVAIVIRDFWGGDVHYVDQSGGENSNRWIYLGRYVFAAGQDRARGSIALDEAGVTGPVDPRSTTQVHFDLVRFDLVEQGDPSALLPVPWAPPGERPDAWLFY
ncbi:MAG: hypothetical protein Kow0059_20150 [Candidatus Sumerlaeia bacterium]